MKNGFRGEDMNRPLLDRLIASARERLERLQSVAVEEEHRERYDRVIATQEERLRRLIEATRRN